MLNNPNPPIKAPKEKEIIFCISLYHSIPPVFSRNNFLFKSLLKSMFDTRNYWRKLKDKKEKEILTAFLTVKETKVKISEKLTGRSYWGVYIINKHLQIIHDEIMEDYKNGLLTVKPYKKPPTKTEITKKLNEYYTKNGINKKIPLRKKNTETLVNEWKKNRNNPTKDTL